jgi:DNA-binding MarR family transcriptional regulator
MPQHENIGEHISRVINKLLFLEKRRVFEYGGIKLYPSELHLMGLIASDGTVNATSMAMAFGVTKGAISQTLSRLQKKGVLYKTKDPYNKNELSAHFTPFGKSALESHRKLVETLNAAYEQYISSLSEAEKEVISNFLKHVEAFVDGLG